MAEKPILFSGEMVRAILEGRKSQTRRVAKALPRVDRVEYHPSTMDDYHWLFKYPSDTESGYWDKCPYGKPGDRLWVRETWRAEELDPIGLDGVRFRADGAFRDIENTREASEAWSVANNNLDLWIKDKWRPSIYMPRWASRINLEIIKVRVEKVQDISQEDAKAEGVTAWHDAHPDHGTVYVPEFKILWNKINGNRGPEDDLSAYSWERNPWVWVIEFKVV